MREWYGWLTLFLMANIAVGMWRLIRGPKPADRILTTLLFATTGVASLVLLSVVLSKPYFIDIALMFAVLATVSAVSFVKRAPPVDQRKKRGL